MNSVVRNSSSFENSSFSSTNPVDESNGGASDLTALAGAQRDLIALTLRCFQAKYTHENRNQFDKFCAPPGTNSLTSTTHLSNSGSTSLNTNSGFNNVRPGVEELVTINVLQEEIALSRSIIEALRRERNLAVSEKKALEEELSDTIASFQQTMKAMQLQLQQQQSQQQSASNSLSNSLNQQETSQYIHNSGPTAIITHMHSQNQRSASPPPPALSRSLPQQTPAPSTSTISAASAQELLSQKDETIKRLKQEVRDLTSRLVKMDGIDIELSKCRNDIQDLYLETEAEKRRSQQLLRDVETLRTRLAEKGQEAGRLQAQLDAERDKQVQLKVEISSSTVYVEELKKQSAANRELFEKLKQQSAQQVKLLEEKLMESVGDKNRLENKLKVIMEEEEIARDNLRSQLTNEITLLKNRIRKLVSVSAASKKTTTIVSTNSLSVSPNDCIL
eukprot:GDKJ01046593.1.p1 GENE.GDKJ01046593.1~~GDKJ01046593.1.p1  ORF type:complete len:472 (+),score=118.27 GDKJ01046593.1:78-1418(+)